MVDTVVFDVDGTLVDSSYHHLLAWSRAFDDVGVRVPAWRLHACMGMGGDHLVEAAAGAVVEHSVGDDVRALWRKAYDELLGEVRPFAGAADLLQEFRHAGKAVVLATSGHDEHIERTLQILEIGRDEFPLVSSADVERTKPAADLITLALDAGGSPDGVLVGDTVWDVEAGRRAGVPVVGVLTGGIACERLEEAGAVRVYPDVDALRESVDDVLALGGDRR
ncbi:HAD family hydrolase [Marmoricola sp. RAF53]|uniref:HAD family hydrolase n=1 Tax=Marmoricola sp. RAF53 TaxID=3233059 RepID=UPI003F95B813